MDAQKFTQELQPQLQQIRQKLHRRPELGLHLPETQAFILNELSGLGLEIQTGTALSSVTAVLRGTSPQRPSENAPVVLLRADMDALAVQEANDLDFRSEIDGLMHACGHDLHMTMLLGAVHTLVAHRDALAGDVVFMFQPGEEMWDGAAIMIEEGVLDAAGPRVDAAFAMHVFSDAHPVGAFSSRNGTIMSAADRLDITVVGRGGHSSAPYRAVDPVPIAAELVLALQTFVTRRFSVFDPVIMGIGAISGGDHAAPNAIPESVTFSVSVRSWSAEARKRWQEEVPRLVEGIASGHQATVKVAIAPGYPATVTNDDETRFVAQTAEQLFGSDRYIDLRDPLSCSEDFSRVLDLVPGSFVVLSAADHSAYVDGTIQDNHSPRVRFDDSVLADGAALYAQLAADRLTQLAQTRG